MQADLIIENGRVLTMDADRPRASALAVLGGTIVAVGGPGEVAGWRGRHTRTVDAAGGSVLPGFNDAHMHLFPGAAELSHLQLAGIADLDGLAAAIRAHAAANPSLPVLLGQGAGYAVAPGGERLTRHHLDAILPGRPLALAACDHHTVWANTAALALAGLLDGGPPLRPGNEVVRGTDGRATGELREMDAFEPILALAGEARSRDGLATGAEPEPAPTESERAADRATLRRGLAWCASHGLTSLQCMDGNLYQLELLAGIEAEEGLPCRVRVPYHHRSYVPLAGLERASAMARRFDGPKLSSGLVKMFFDGVLESWTAWLIEPYADRPGWRGEPLFTREAFETVAVEADRRGLQVAVHAIGDAAVRAALDGFAAARRANGARDSRHRIEHVELTTPADIPRFAELGVIASLQPLHAPAGAAEPALSRIGRARWPAAFASRSLHEAGARLAFSSDWPVVPVDPLASIQAAVTRTPFAAGLPRQDFGVEQAIAFHTAGAAYAEFREAAKGVLRPGMAADIVVLSGDVAAAAPEAIGTLRAVLTVCDGRITHAAQAGAA